MEPWDLLFEFYVISIFSSYLRLGEDWVQNSPGLRSNKRLSSLDETGSLDDSERSLSAAAGAAGSLTGSSNKTGNGGSSVSSVIPRLES